MASPVAPSKPTIVFVPGAFHTPDHYKPMNDLLHQSSYPSVALSLPSIGGLADRFAPGDDIRAIRSEVEKLVDTESKDVVLVMHSYGGVPGSQAVTGLEKSVRTREGKEGGVIHVLFIAAFVLETGQSLVEALGGGLPPWAVADGTILRPANTSPVFYSDLPPEEAELYTSLLQPQSAIPSTIPVANVCYDLDVPITYLLCNDDPAVGMFNGILQKTKRRKWKVERIDGGHSPFLGRKADLLGVLAQCSGR